MAIHPPLRGEKTINEYEKAVIEAINDSTILSSADVEYPNPSNREYERLMNIFDEMISIIEEVSNPYARNEKTELLAELQSERKKLEIDDCRKSPMISDIDDVRYTIEARLSDIISYLENIESERENRGIQNKLTL